MNPKFVEAAFKEIMAELRAIRQAIESLNEIAVKREAMKMHELEIEQNLSRGSGPRGGGLA